MIYTIGNKETYSIGFEDDGPDPVKVGRMPEEDYPGGCVWRTREEAEDGSEFVREKHRTWN